jgi:competence ComEA-like helix-hairpin-helix protein
MDSVRIERGWRWQAKVCTGWLCLLLLIPFQGTGPSRLDLNLATAEQLERLPSIGPLLAERIIAHRTRNGPFRRAQEIVAVRGVSPRRYRQIAHLITVSPQVK